jgi:hypothetical protein
VEAAEGLAARFAFLRGPAPVWELSCLFMLAGMHRRIVGRAVSLSSARDVRRW